MKLRYLIKVSCGFIEKEGVTPGQRIIAFVNLLSDSMKEKCTINMSTAFLQKFSAQIPDQVYMISSEMLDKEPSIEDVYYANS